MFFDRMRCELWPSESLDGRIPSRKIPVFERTFQILAFVGGQAVLRFYAFSEFEAAKNVLLLRVERLSITKNGVRINNK